MVAGVGVEFDRRGMVAPVAFGECPLTLRRMRPALQYRQRLTRTVPPPLPASPQSIPYAAVQPLVHPDDGQPLRGAARPRTRSMPGVELQGAARAAEVARARAERRAPRLGRRRRPPLVAPRRPPTAADLLVLRDGAMRCAFEMTKAVRSSLGAGPLLCVVLNLSGVLSIRVRGGRAVDAAAARTLRLPGAIWSAWARIGWRMRWSPWSMHAGSRWCGRRGLPAMRRVQTWRRLWNATAWTGVRLMTAREWAVRTGAGIPDWLSA